MDYEKEYNKLKAGIKNAYLYAQTGSTKAVLENILPGLKESEEEKVRKAILEFVRQSSEVLDKQNQNNMIAWLEKQGEPIDKVEPKFHKGEWVVWQDKCYKVNYNGCGYELIDQNGLHTSLEYGTIDENAHLWTIADAKEGDVLEDDGTGMVFIFKNIEHDNHLDSDVIRYFIRYSFNGISLPLENGGHLGVIGEYTNYTPATKEQCDTLMKAMTDAGYTFDFEKKELKKLTQQEVTKISDQVKDSAWSEEDEHKAKNTIYFLDTAKKHYASTVELDACIDWLKSLKDKVQPQPQPKQGWSEEDEKMLDDAIGAVGAADYYTYDDKQEIENWLKSLKQRIGG